MEELPILGAGLKAPDACTLPTAEQPLRLAEFDELFASHVRSADRAGPLRLRLELTPEAAVAARAADLTARETGCCSFFTFTLTMTGGQLLLDVQVPETQVDVLDAIADRARRADRAGRADPADPAAGEQP